MALFDQIYSLMTTIAGFAFVVGLVGFIYSRDANHWRYLAKSYERNWQTPISERWGNVVLYGKFPVSKAYNGILKLGIHSNGLSLKVMMPPQNIFCRPLFVPFKDIRGWDQTWYLNAKTVELELEHAPEVKMAMPRDQMEWIRSAGGSEIEIMDQASPHRDKPVLWHAFLIVSSAVVILGTVFVILPGIFS